MAATYKMEQHADTCIAMDVDILMISIWAPLRCYCIGIKVISLILSCGGVSQIAKSFALSVIRRNEKLINLIWILRLQIMQSQAKNLIYTRGRGACERVGRLGTMCLPKKRNEKWGKQMKW